MVPANRKALIKRALFLIELETRSRVRPGMDTTMVSAMAGLFTDGNRQELLGLMTALGVESKSPVFEEACEVLGDAAVLNIQGDVMRIIQQPLLAGELVS